MANDIGKNPAIVRLPDGCVLNFFNRTAYSMEERIEFYSDNPDIPRYLMTNSEELISGSTFRCAYFSRSFPTSGIDPFPRLVIYVPNVEITEPYNIPAQPLFELISPTILRTDTDKFQLSWWSNVDDESMLQSVQQSGIKIYDPKAIKRFSTSDLDGFKDNKSATKILCSAAIKWENLYQLGGGVTDRHQHLFPVIKDVVIVASISNEGYITDFSTGGGGGGMARMHDHTSNDQCGFAAAVFMPSANVRVFNWK